MPNFPPYNWYSIPGFCNKSRWNTKRYYPPHPPPPPPPPPVNMVAVGVFGQHTIATSSDGTVWKGIGAPSLAIQNIKWNDKSKIWIGMNGFSSDEDIGGIPAFSISSDGINWHFNYNLSKSLPNFIAEDIAWNDEKTWVMRGKDLVDDSCIATSIDYGKTWNVVNESSNIFYSINYVVSHKNKWVAVGQGKYTIATSSDGINWKGVPETQNNSIFDDVDYVACNNDGSTWVAVGVGKYSVAISSNYGINWKGVVGSLSSFYSFSSLLSVGFSVAWNGKMWIVSGFGATNSFITSQDGNTWSPGGNINENVGLVASYVAWNNKSNMWVTCGVGKYNIATSPDGVTWKGGNINYKNLTPAITSVAWNDDDSMWIASLKAENISIIVTSDDHGKTWKVVSESIDIDKHISRLIWDSNNNIWIALGHSISISSNGSDWKVADTGGIFSALGNINMVWNKSISKWVAVGEGNYTIATSSDGEKWNGVAETQDRSIFYSSVYVAYNEKSKLCVAVGEGKYTIATSSDGINWTGVPETQNNSIFDSTYRVACNNDGSTWVAVGEGKYTIATSSNYGINWKGVVGAEVFARGLNVTWDNNNSIWVAMGYGTYSIATSPDGIKWTGVPESNLMFGIVLASSWVGGPESSLDFLNN